MNVLTTWLQTLLAIAVGALFTALMARKYYEKAAQELSAETKKLRHLEVTVLRALEEAGLAKLGRDESGNITGLTLSASITEGARAGDSFRGD